MPDANARKGLMPDGSNVPNLKKGMLPYANYFWPAPNGPVLGGGTAHSYNNPAQSINEQFGLARFDYTISSNDSFSANYTIDNGLRNVPWGGGGGGDPNFVTNSDIHAQSLGLQETHIFSPNLVNVTTLGYAGTFATLVNAPAVPIPAELVFLPPGNPGAIVIGGGISAASAVGRRGDARQQPYHRCETLLHRVR